MSRQESQSLADSPGGEVPADSSARVVRWIYVATESPETIHSFILRWNGQWIAGDRFARDYAAGVMLFDSEVTQAVSRFNPSRTGAVGQEVETHAAAWAAVLAAFEAASFRDADRETLLAAVRAELHTYWSQLEPCDAAHQAAILDRAMFYLTLQDRASHLMSAARIVNSFLRTLELREPIAPSALSRHLTAIFGYRIIRDIYRLSAASRLRMAITPSVQEKLVRGTVLEPVTPAV